MFRIYLVFIAISLLLSCKQGSNEYQKISADTKIYHQSVKALTDVIVHDIFSPPVASRIYCYATIAGYEGIRYKDASFASLSTKISHFPAMPSPDNGQEYSYEMVSVLAMLKVGKSMIFTEESLQSQIDKVQKFYADSGMPKDVLTRSASLADSISARIIAWAAGDNYKQSRSFPKYSIQNDPSSWKPTPPGFMDAIEPSWNKIRPFTLDSAAQFKPLPPTTFNVKDKNSAYYKEVMETYLAVKNGNQEQKDIANFWDCNPFKLNVSGHVMHATKKISPGGHWINIIGLTCQKANKNFVQTAYTYAMVSIGLADAFISCWDEKYRSKTIRPETVINEYIDPNWVPLLQTPPFPEYPSGHSVASGAAAVIATQLLGENFAFTDDTEVEFGLKPRSFTSFYQAADEAAMSRLYGGIHYMPAIKNGLAQGKAIGSMIMSKDLSK